MPKPDVSTAVLIAGAGPTGLALGCDLARRGVAFRIIDKAPRYFAGSRGKGLQPRSLEVFDDFGVVDRILANGRFHLPFRGYDGAKVLGDRDVHEGRNPTPDVPYASPLIIPQFRVEEILRDCLESHGGRVELETELISFEQDGQAVTATVAGPNGSEEIAAQYLVGADGGHSFVRGRLDIPFEGETWDTERMFVGDVRLEGLDRDHWHSWRHPALGWLALCPLPSTDLFQLQAQIETGEPEEPTLDRFRQIVEERTGGALGIRLQDATWLSLYRANVRMVARYREGRVFLAGDAAHVHSPAGGQGMNTGIQDAYNLGWKLGHVLSGAPEALLDTYEEERLPVAAQMLGITSKLHRESLSGSTGVQKRGPETLQLGINYRGCSLAVECRDAPGDLRAGDRAPDAPCQDAAGRPMRLFDVFRGPHMTLLLFGSCEEAVLREIRQRYPAIRVCPVVPAGEAGPPDGIVDSGGHASRAYDVPSGTLLLVRPDGYIGVITEDGSAGAIADYPARTCG